MAGFSMKLGELEVLVLSANYWKMDDGTEGVTVWYVPTTDITPVCNNKDDYGIKPVKATVPVSCLRDLTYCPGIYLAEMHLAGASGNKQGLVPKEFKLQSYAAITPVEKQ